MPLIPDDDDARLVAADALVERGDPRGEFIQLQIALARDPDQPELMKREDELPARHARLWTARHGTDVRARFRRGTIWHAEVRTLDALHALAVDRPERAAPP